MKKKKPCFLKNIYKKENQVNIMLIKHSLHGRDMLDYIIMTCPSS